MRAHRIVERDGLEDIQQLALVLVNALHMHVEHGGGIDLDAHARRDEVGEFILVVPLDRREALAEAGILGERPGL